MLKHRLIKNLNIEDFLSDPKINHPQLFEYIKKQEPIKVLDIGANVPLCLFVLYHNFETKLLRGLDARNEIDCIHECIRLRIEESRKEEYKNVATFFDVYKLMLEVSDSDKPKLINKDEFDEVFCKPYKFVLVEDFLEECNELFEIIISSNFLHLFTNTEVKNMLPKIKALIKSNGLIFLRIQDQHDPNKLWNNYFIELLNNDFPNGEIFEYYEDNKWQHTVFCNVQGLINL